MSKPQSEDSEGGIKEILQARGIEISCDLGRSVWFFLSLSLSLLLAWEATRAHVVKLSYSSSPMTLNPISVQSSLAIH